MLGKLLPPSGHSGHGRTCCWLAPVANDPERTSRCFGLGADIKNFAPELRSNNSSGLRSGIACWWCAAASMRYHDEIRVFSRLMAKSVVGNNQ
jgi:hypothetical protein